MLDIGIVRIRVAVIFFLLLTSFIVSGQISPERLAQQRMQKEKWSKAEQAIKKSLAKDSLGVEANYVYAQWYFSFANPAFDIDAAYRFIKISILNFLSLDDRQRDRLKRFPLDSLILLRKREQMDSAAFERAKGENTEKAYQFFVDHYTGAKQQANAIELRDEVSFLDALKENTYQSFEQYLIKYPKSHRAPEAKGRYEKLLFEDKTRDGRLKSFVSFFRQFAKSPYRENALREIFEISTASGRASDFMAFIDQYGHHTPFSKKARDIAYHLLRQEDRIIPKQILSDSLRESETLEKGFIIPFLKNAKYGFMDQYGAEIIKERFDHIDSEYLCGNITDDFLITEDGLISRSGSILLSGEIKEIKDLGSGILLVQNTECNRLIHKSGFNVVANCVEDARVLADRFLAVKMKNQFWELFTLAGRKILANHYESIEAVDEIIVFVQAGKRVLNTSAQITAAADKEALPVNAVFDEVKKLSSGKIWVKNGSLEGVVNSNLEFIIPLDRQSLTMTSFGFTKRYLNKITTVGVSDAIDQEEFNDIKPYLSWLGLYRQGDIKLYHLPTSKIIETNLDSLWFANKLALAIKHDSLKVIFSSGRRVFFPASTKMDFIKSPDSVRYMSIVDQHKRIIFDVDTGQKKFTLECDKIEELGYNLFLVEQRGKAGMVGLDGKMVLPIEYDAIVKSSDQFVSLLKNKRFGIFDLKSKSLIKTTFERNLRFYNESVLIAYKDGRYGLIGLDSKPISGFDFDEVNFWTDSVAMVKSNFRWKVLNFYDAKVIEDHLKDYRLIKNSKEEKIAIIHKENEYGVLSSTKGIIIPATFTDVVNLGTDERPLYFTEKQVEEADIFVVIYYDSDGKLIRREIYESDEYDRIYCR